MAQHLNFFQFRYGNSGLFDIDEDDENSFQTKQITILSQKGNQIH